MRESLKVAVQFERTNDNRFLRDKKGYRTSKIVALCITPSRRDGSLGIKLPMAKQSYASAEEAKRQLCPDTRLARKTAGERGCHFHVCSSLRLLMDCVVKTLVDERFLTTRARAAVAPQPGMPQDSPQARPLEQRESPMSSGQPSGEKLSRPSCPAPFSCTRMCIASLSPWRDRCVERRVLASDSLDR